MCKANVIIADDDEVFRSILEGEICQEADLNLIRSVDNGIAAYKEILKGHADIVVLDMIMPGLDGLGVLEKIRYADLKRKPRIIFFSGIDEPQLTQRALNMGASYYLKKPFDTNVLVSRIKNLHNERHKKNTNKIDNIMNDIMSELGISEKSSGYVYLKKAILIVLENKGSMEAITKVIYPKIAAEYKTTDKNVEKGMRDCIARSYKNSENKERYRTFNFHKRPTNSEFIIKMVNRIKFILDI